MKWQMLFDKVSKSGDTKEKVIKKFAGLETYLGRMKSRVDSGFVTLSKGERWGYKVKTMFRIPGREVVVEGKSATLLSAIDEAYDKASAIVRKYLDKIQTKKKR
jgi:ribosome-associated translation inhibitor RaiA